MTSAYYNALFFEHVTEFKSIGFRPIIPCISEQVPTLNGNTTMKRSHSPIKNYLSRDMNNGDWVHSESVANKRKRCNSSNSIGMNGIKKKSRKRTPQGMIILLYDILISFIAVL